MHAFKNAAFAHDLDQNTDVVGVVRGWGWVAVHRLGWRAQFAQPLALFVTRATPSASTELGRHYECDATPVPDLSAGLAAAASIHKELCSWPV